MRDISVPNTGFFIGDGKIGGDFLASGSFKEIFLDSARIGGTLHLEHGSIGERGKIDRLNLAEAQIDTVLQVRTQIRDLHAPGLQVRSYADVDLNGLANANIGHVDEDQITIDLEHSRISGYLNIVNVQKLSSLNLSASSAADLSLQNVNWSTDALLDLRNAHFSTIRNGNDKPKPIWPKKTQIAGFTYTNIPTITATNSSLDSILEWLRLDQNGSGQYTQIAALFSAQGDRDNAAKFQLAAREQEMKTICSQGITGYCIFLHALWWVDGFGIGDYIWSVLWWIRGICVFGTFVVLTVPSAGVPVLNALRNAAGIGSNIRTHSGFRRIGAEVWTVLKGVIWALGAGLEKMLPFVHLDKSFTEFFEKEEGFRLWQKVIFTMLALLGSILGLFLAAAAAGLTQRG